MEKMQQFQVRKVEGNRPAGNELSIAASKQSTPQAKRAWHFIFVPISLVNFPYHHAQLLFSLFD